MLHKEVGAGVAVEAPGIAKPGKRPVIEGGESRQREGRTSWRLQLANLGILPAIVVLLIIGTSINREFLSVTNVLNILSGSSYLAFLAVAEALVIIAGQFDLSLEGTIAFTPMLGAWLASAHAPGSGLGLGLALGTIITLGAGAVIGLFNAILVVSLGISSFLVTLAMQIALAGLSYGLTSGLTINEPSGPLVWLGEAQIGRVPVSVIAAVALVVLVTVLLRYTRTGRQLYAIGGNREAARRNGIRTRRIWFGLFIVSGLLGSLAGMIISGQTAAVIPDQGAGITLTIFAAVAIGGVSLNGGKGYVWGVGLGVLLLGTTTDLLTIAQVPPQVIDAIEGAVVLAALVFNRFTGGRARESTA